MWFISRIALLIALAAVCLCQNSDDVQSLPIERLQQLEVSNEKLQKDVKRLNDLFTTTKVTLQEQKRTMDQIVDENVLLKKLLMSRSKPLVPSAPGPNPAQIPTSRPAITTVSPSNACPNSFGYTQASGLCILAIRSKMSFGAAENFCRSKGGRVYEPTYSQTYYDVLRAAEGLNIREFWLGLKAESYGSTNYVTVSGRQDPGWRNWGPFAQVSECVMTDILDKQWNAEDCHQDFSVVCQIP